jgi:hypothetical protein
LIHAACAKIFRVILSAFLFFTSSAPCILSINQQANRELLCVCLGRGLTELVPHQPSAARWPCLERARPPTVMRVDGEDEACGAFSA